MKTLKKEGSVSSRTIQKTYGQKNFEQLHKVDEFLESRQEKGCRKQKQPIPKSSEGVGRTSGKVLANRDAKIPMRWLEVNPWENK